MDDDLEREIRSHLEMENEDLRESGLSGEEARYAARRALGNATLLKEELRDLRRWSIVDRLARDLKYAVRMLRRDRGFTVVAVVTLMLGIGATTAIFTVVNSVLLRPLPYPEPQRLLSVQEKGPSFGLQTSYPDVEDWRAGNHVFSGMASYHGSSFTLSGDHGAVHVLGTVASANLLDVLQVKPALGRAFQPDDEQPNARVVLLSDRLWHEQFHADPSLVGRSLKLGQRDFTVIGVMPAGFRFPPTFDGDYWTTSALDQGAPRIQRGYSYLSVIARLKPDITAEQAQADLDVIARRLAKDHPDTNRLRTSVRIMPELQRIVGNSQRGLVTLLGVAAGVLLIACVNLANMTLARNLARQREIAIRAALGARRRSVVTQLLAESVLVSLFGGCAGVALAMWGTNVLLTIIPKAIPRSADIRTDLRVLGFALLLSITTGILFGLFPALKISRPNLDNTLKESRHNSSDTLNRRRFRRILIAAETALAIVLLTAAGLLTTSYLRLLHVDTGVDRRNVLTFDLSLPVPPYTGVRQVQFYDDLQTRLGRLPNVRFTALSWPTPMSGTATSGFEIDGRLFPRGEQPNGGVHVVSPGYFRALGMQLRAGRDFATLDDAKSPPVIIVDETLARRFFPGVNPLGKRIKPSFSALETPPWREIVGIVSRTKTGDLAEEFEPQYYMPIGQFPDFQPALVAKAIGDPLSLVPFVRDIATAIDKDVPVFDIQSLDEIVARSTARERLNTVLFGLFGGLAVLLAAVGIYGVANYSVNRATHDLGIRMALGAQARHVLRLMLFGTMRDVVVGLVIGLVLTLSLTRLIQNLLFDVRPTDPILIGGACCAFIAVALVASYIPARRATKVDPVIALRCD